MSAEQDKPPEPDEFELTLIGPGYGESLVVHLGHGDWMIVDSCVDSEGAPHPLRYLERLGVEPSAAVRFVAPWIRGGKVKPTATDIRRILERRAISLEAP